MFTADDLRIFNNKGIEMSAVERQLEYFEHGFDFLRLDRAATIGDGIRQLNAQEKNNLIETYNKERGNRKICKFVPASGAATRMFKDLYEYIQKENMPETASVKEIFERLEDFAFFPELKQIIEKQSIEATDRKKIASAILFFDGLNYGNLPKGMLAFHRYATDVRTALEEHLVEGASYAVSADGTVNLHFTVSPEHQQEFETLVNSTLKKYEDFFNIHYNVCFSQQKSSTDILAVDAHNKPFRNTDGGILFRPGGHGALIENLNDIDADIIFIKNIDNVSHDRIKPVTVQYKKALAGLLIKLHEQIADFCRLLNDSNCCDKNIKEAFAFLTGQLFFQPPSSFSAMTTEARRNYLLNIFQRPLRVCGMVKNEGEPGGGPFWVRNADGSASLQIVEPSQIYMDDAQQKELAAKATHFNPVDLVCAVKDREGKRFNLIDYRDPNTGFISKKSKDGIELKAQELPGLWNGAMAHWNTVFVEVPIETFNPVKTINDLLREQHQST